MTQWFPEQCIIDRRAMEHDHGRRMAEYIRGHNIPVTVSGRPRSPADPDPRRAFYRAKRTLIITVKRSFKFDPCRPSADYQFPLATGCPALCHYCYLHASPGVAPTVRVYANIEQILAAVSKQADSDTSFEVSSTSDPVALEHITGSLARTIKYFGDMNRGWLRFVTKFAAVDPLLNLDHRRRTTIRFSINHPDIIHRYEPGTAALPVRIAAAERTARAGYKVGFMIAPIMAEDNWQRAYTQLISSVARQYQGPDPEFELITHRFTRRGATLIRERFSTDLDVDEANRNKKFGRYGHTKFIYPEQTMTDMKQTLTDAIDHHFPGSTVRYFT